MNAHRAKVIHYNQFVQMAHQGNVKKLCKSTPNNHSGECTSRIESPPMQPVISYSSFIDSFLESDFSDRGSSTQKSDLHNSKVVLCPKCESGPKESMYSSSKSIEPPTKEDRTGMELCTDVSDSTHNSEDHSHKSQITLKKLSDVRKTEEEPSSRKLIESASRKQKHNSGYQCTNVVESSLPSPRIQSLDKTLIQINSDSDISQCNEENETAKLDEKQSIAYKESIGITAMIRDNVPNANKYTSNVKVGSMKEKCTNATSLEHQTIYINRTEQEAEIPVATRKRRRKKWSNTSPLAKQNTNLKDASITPLIRHNVPNEDKYTSNKNKNCTNATSLDQQTIYVSRVEPESMIGNEPGEKNYTSCKSMLLNAATETKVNLIEPQAMIAANISSANKYSESEKVMHRKDREKVMLRKEREKVMHRKEREKSLTIASPEDANRAKYQMTVANCELDIMEINNGNKMSTTSWTKSAKVTEQNENSGTTRMIISREAKGIANTSACQLFTSESIFMPDRMPDDTSNTEQSEVMSTSSEFDTYKYKTNGKTPWKRKIMLLKSNSSLTEQNTNLDTTQPLTMVTSIESEATANTCAHYPECIGTNDKNNTTHKHICRVTQSTNNDDKVEHEMHIPAPLCEFRDSRDNISLANTLTCVSSCTSPVLLKKEESAEQLACIEHLCSTTQEMNNEELVKHHHNEDNLQNVTMQVKSQPHPMKKKRKSKWIFKFHHSFFYAFTHFMPFPKLKYNSN